MERPLKIGIVSFAHPHAGAYASILRSRDDVELLTTDPGIGYEPDNDSRGAANAARLGVDYVGTYEDLLHWRPDAVVICTESARHLPFVEAAARAGAHILCEKPLAIDVADAERMVSICDDAGVLLMVALPIRFAAEFRLLQQALAAGELGHIIGATGSNVGKNPVVSRSWFVNPEESGGGSLSDLAVHMMDLLDALLDGAHPVSVYATTNRVLHADTASTVETGALLTITYENGVVATIDSSWSQPASADDWGQLNLQVIGTRATAEIDPFASRLEGISDESGGNFSVGFGEDLNAFMIGEFLDAIREQRRPTTDGDLGLRLVRLLSAAKHSAVHRVRVRL